MKTNCPLSHLHPWVYTVLRLLWGVAICGAYVLSCDGGRVDNHRENASHRGLNPWPTYRQPCLFRKSITSNFTACAHPCTCCTISCSPLPLPQELQINLRCKKCGYQSQLVCDGLALITRIGGHPSNAAFQCPPPGFFALLESAIASLTIRHPAATAAHPTSS